MSPDLLVGRGELLAELTDRLASGGERVLLTGPAGVGKSAVARAVARRMPETTTVATVRASATFRGVAFGVVWPLIGEVRGLADAEQRAVEQVGRGLAGLGERLLLVVDDWDQLDAASMAAIDVAGSLVDMSVLATVRDDEANSASVVVRLRHDGWKVSELEGLDRSAVAELAAQRLEVERSAVAPSLADDLVRWTNGNPLFVGEAIDVARREGGIEYGAGVVRLAKGFRLGGPLSEMVASRVDRLEGAERDLFGALAVAGELDQMAVHRLGLSEVALELGERGIVASDAGRVRAAHPMAAEVMRARLTPIEHTVLCRRLAGATAGGRADALLVVHWHEMGGVEPGRDLLVAAARAARQRGVLRAAERYASAAYDAAPGDCFAIVMLGEVRAAAGDAVAADAVFGAGQRECAAAVAAVADTAVPAEVNSALGALAYVTLIRMATAFWGFGRLDVAAAAGRLCRTVLDGAATRFDSARALTLAIGDEILAEEAVEVAFTGDLAGARRRAVELLEPGRVAARRRDDDGGGFGARAEARAHLTLAGVLGAVGRPEEARCSAYAARRAAADVPAGLGRDELGSRASLAIVDAELLCGDVVAAAAAAEAELTAAAGDAERVMFAAYAAGRVAVEQDDLATAVRHLESAYRLDRARPHRGGSRWPAVVLARVLAESGRVDEAAAVLAVAAGGADEVAVAGPMAHAAAAIAAARGDRHAAAHVLETSLDALTSRGLHTAAALTAYELVQRRGRTSDVDRLVTATERLDQGLPRLLHRWGLARRDGVDAMRALAVELRSRGLARLAGETELAAGASARRRGERRGWAAVTRRQREIAELAANGSTNPQIAERLGLSVRTVANQLQHVYTATGCTRGTLGTVLDGGGAAPGAA